MTNIIDDTPREKSALRWVLCILCCTATFGVFYCFDTVGSVHEHLKSQFDFLGENFEYYFQILYSIYGLVNVFLPFIGGALIKIYGSRIMFVIFGIFALVGQLIVFLGSKYFSIYTMIFGRIIFAIGGENLTVCQNDMIVKWFFKSEISFPMALTLTISRVGSFANDVLSPIFAGEERINTKLSANNAFFWGTVFSFISFLIIVAMYLIDYFKEKAILNNNNTEAENVNKSETNENTNNFFSMFKKLNLMVILVCLICMASYGSLMPFNFLSVGFYTSNGISKRLAGIYMGIPYAIGALLAPLLGIFIDHYGYRVLLLFIGTTLFIISYILFCFLSPSIPILLLGLGYGNFAAVLWPSISIALEHKEMVGFAYGVIAGIQNIAVTVNPLIVAWILVNYNNYYYCLCFFIFISICCGILCIWISYENKYNRGDVLNKTKYADEAENTLSKSLELGYYDDSNIPLLNKN